MLETIVFFLTVYPGRKLNLQINVFAKQNKLYHELQHFVASPSLK